MTWGERLQLRIGQRRLNPVVAAIRTVTGGVLGSSRNTFAALCGYDTPPSPGTRDYDRAFVLLIALGENPADWDIHDRYVSPMVVAARDLLGARSGWTLPTAA